MTEDRNRELICELLNLSDWALKAIGRPGMTGEGRKVAEHYANGGEVELHNNPVEYPTFMALDICYRIKQPTRWVNGFEVPDCLKERPPYKAPYFIEDLIYDGYFRARIYLHDLIDKHALERGIAHATSENAAANTKARLGIDPYGEGEQ